MVLKPLKIGPPWYVLLDYFTTRPSFKNLYEQITKEFEGRKYLHECAPLGYVNIWTEALLFMPSREWCILKIPRKWYMYLVGNMLTVFAQWIIFGAKIVCPWPKRPQFRPRTPKNGQNFPNVISKRVQNGQRGLKSPKSDLKCPK